ncbi:hypothetical protein ACYSNR_13780 [Enterococcus sp. LJL128]
MGKQWGHGYHTRKMKGRQEASWTVGAIGLTYLVAKRGYKYLEKKYPEKISAVKRKSNYFKNQKI